MRKESKYGVFSRSNSEKVYPVLEHSGHFLLVMFLTFWQGCCRALQTKDLVGVTLQDSKLRFYWKKFSESGVHPDTIW